MNSKILSLLWERWRRTRWALIAACLSPLLGPLMYNTGYINLENAIHVTNLIWYLSFIILIFFLILGQCETREVDLSFPKRLFRFPVRTIILIIVYMGYGIASVALQYLIVIGINELFFELISDRWTTFLVLMTVYIAFQTFSWVGWPVLIFFLVLWVAGVILLPFYTDKYYPNILCPAIILLCCVISFWCVSMYRYGTKVSYFQWIDKFFNLFSRRSSKPFSSPLQAQIWFEMRQTAYIFPLSALCFIGPMLGYAMFSAVYMTVYNMKYAPIVTFMFVLTIIAAFIAGGLVFGIFHRDYTSGALSFWLRRPMATQTLAIARLHAMMRSLAWVIAIFAVVTLMVVAYDWAIGVLDVKALSPVKWALKYSSPPETITMTVLGLYGFAIFYWTLLRLGLVLVFGIFVLSIITWLIGDVAASWVWTALVVGLPLSVLVAFFVARLRNLITTGMLVCSACLFPLAVVSLWAVPWWLTTSESMSKGLPILNLFQIILIIAGATLPFIPVVTTPMIMDRLRHR
jgi:uncharacterized integral membrane protein